MSFCFILWLLLQLLLRASLLFFSLADLRGDVGFTVSVPMATQRCDNLAQKLDSASIVCGSSPPFWPIDGFVTVILSKISSLLPLLLLLIEVAALSHTQWPNYADQI